jgi:hypothetical protein
MANPGDTPLIPGELIDLLARAEIKGVKDDLHSLSTRFDSGFTLLSQKIDNLRTPQYSLVVSVVGLGMMVLVAIGGFAYWPIRETQSDLKDSIRALSQGVVYQRRYDSGQVEVIRQFEELKREKATKETMAAIIADRDNRMSGIVRRLERLESATSGRTPRAKGDD